MNYASIRTCDVANGEGVRVSLFVSGCTHRCKGCFNEEAWDFAYGQPFTEKTESELIAALEPGHIAGLSKTVWVYTGCVLETELRSPSHWRTELTDEFLSLVDVLVDGPFVEPLKDISLAFRGSSNQRVLRLADGRRSA